MKYTTGHIAKASESSIPTVTRVASDLAIEPTLTPSGHRRFEEGDAKKIIREIRLRRDPVKRLREAEGARAAAV